MHTTSTVEPLLEYFVLNSDFLAFTGALISVFISIHLYNLSAKKQIERERYDKLIFPLFDLLEPHLFCEVDSSTFQAALKIIRDNKSIAGGHLLYLLDLCEHTPSQENFNSLCKFTNSELDRLCKILCIKKRSFFYRLNKNQYQTKLMLYLYAIYNVFVFLLSLAALFGVTLFINFAFQRILS